MTSGSRRTSVVVPCAIDAAEIERGDAVADAEHEIGVMLHQQHADAAVADDADDGGEALDLRHGQAAGGFVEQQEFRLHRQGAGDFQKALRGVFQQIGAPVHHRCRGQRRAAWRRHGRGCPLPRAAGAGLRVRSPEIPIGTMRPAAQHGVVQHRQRQHQLRCLEGAREAGSRPILHRLPRDVAAGQMDAALVDPVVAGDQVQQRGLAAAVGTDQAVHLARTQFQRNAVHGGQAAEALGDRSGFQTLVHGRARIAMRNASRSGSMLVATCGSRRSRAARLVISSPKPPGSTSTTSSRMKP